MHIVVSSADRVSGGVSDFQANTPIPLDRHPVRLCSVTLPNTVTSPTVPTYLAIHLGSWPTGAMGTDTPPLTTQFVFPFVPGQVTQFNPSSVFDQPLQCGGVLNQLRVRLTDLTGAPVTFSGGDWSFVIQAF
jgi:hypothetical protein